MANRIDVKIGSDIRGFKKGVAGVKSRLKSLAGSAAGMMGVGLGVAGITMGIKKLVDNGDRIGKVSKRLGVTAEFYQKLSFAAERSGASQGAAEKGIKKMQATIFDAGTGLKTYIRYFDELGINYKDLEGKSPEKQFKIISSALNGVTDATRKSALAQKIFGRAGIELIPMLKDYNDLAQELEDRDAIISNENIKAAEDFKDAMTNIGSVIQASLMNSGLLTWLADIIDKMDAAHKFKMALSQGKKDGATGEYMKEKGWFDHTVDATAGMFGKGRFGKAFQAANPFSMAAKGLKHFGIAGTRDGGKDALISLPAISKKDVSTAKANRLAAKQAEAEAAAKRKAAQEGAKNRDAEAKAAKKAARAADRSAKAEERKQAKQAAFLKDMRHKIAMQKLINAGKEKEARIQEQVYRMKKQGITLTPEKLADIEKLDTLKNADKDLQAVASVRSDRLARIGGTIGNAKNIINQADAKRNSLLEQIAENTLKDDVITESTGASWQV